MLFNSFSFIFAFLPITLIGFFLLAQKNNYLAAGWLVLLSLIFYGYWNPVYVALLLGSITFNFITGINISRFIENGRTRIAKNWLIFGITINVLLLGYYKYTGFFLTNWNSFTEGDIPVPDITLPLGISFFTFTQIAFLVDAFQGHVKEYRFMHYSLFVSYFPHLLAGPVLHHKEMMPQFADEKTYTLNYQNLVVGLTVFFFGLFKKVILADTIAEFVDVPFAAAAAGKPLPLLDAWGGALAYALQIYFDFSAYSDMAIGLSLMFGVRLPLNFNSPYKAASIIDFWRRWHMTLSRFLRDYLYIPLGGNRKGPMRRYLNLVITMLLGGLWHGANWTFVVWGALHGFYLLINHFWRSNVLSRGLANLAPGIIRHVGAVSLTFLATVVAWVFFRASDLTSAGVILEGMTGHYGIVMPEKWLHKFGDFGQWLSLQGVEFRDSKTFRGNSEVFKILLGLCIVWGMPNTQQITERFRPALSMPDPAAIQEKWWHWRLSNSWLTVSIIASSAAILFLTEISEFLYFQF